ncbi:MAG TPA: hypothetical protein IAC40_05845 [Candidatus Faecivivens stercorigallinarum]|nr:hypothetical protein [Candidatus Faecivivens stercorigallinarum]
MKFGKKTRDEREAIEERDEDSALLDHMEKGDLTAMILSALLILVPVAIVVLAVMVFGGMLLYRI